MTVNEYQDKAMRTANRELSAKEQLLNGVMGLCGEAGEAIDIVKKWMAQGHDLDRSRLASELGDIAWYLAQTATALGLRLEDILSANIENSGSGILKVLKGGVRCSGRKATNRARRQGHKSRAGSGRDKRSANYQFRYKCLTIKGNEIKI